MAEVKNVPKLRFPGFTEPWEQRKLSEIALQTYGGGTPKTSNEEFWKGNIPWIQSSDLIEDQLFNVKPRKYISQEAISKSATKLVTQNSIAIVTRVGVGKLAFMPFSYATSQDFLSLSELKIEPEFAVYALYKMMRLVSNEVQGTSIKGITKDELLAKEILIPDCEEQKKIGAYLHNLDNLITLHQRKYETLLEYKKGLLQKMFPKAGETVPEIRFPGFDGEWEEKKLGDLGNTFTGLSGKTKDDFGHGDAQYITYMNIFSNPIVKRNGMDPIEIDAKQNEVKKGDIFFTTSSETPEEVGMSSVLTEDCKNTYLNSFCFGFRPSVEMNSYFIAFMLRNPVVRRKIEYLAQGSTRYNISKNEMLKLSLLMPPIEEQQKIGSFFKALDEKIELQKQKVDAIKEYKKGLLQQMFI